MRKTLAALLFLSLVLPPAEALPIRHVDDSEKVPEPVKPKPPKSEGPSYFERLFSTGEAAKPAPKPASKPTAKPTPKPVAKSLPTPEPPEKVEKAEKIERPTAKPTVKPVARAKPKRPAPSVATGPKEDAPAKVKVEPAADETVSPPPVKATPPAPAKVEQAASKGDQLPPPPKGKGAKSKTVAKKAATPPAELDLTGMDDGAKFKAVKAQAMEDPEVKDLKAKADGEVDDAAAQKALVAYNRALFKKIRELEPSVSAYSERVEASMTKRLSAEKAKP